MPVIAGFDKLGVSIRSCRMSALAKPLRYLRLLYVDLLFWRRSQLVFA